MSYDKNKAAALRAISTQEFQAALGVAMSAYASEVGNATVLPMAHALKDAVSELAVSKGRSSKSSDGGFKAAIISDFGKGNKWIKIGLDTATELLDTLVNDENENAMNLLSLFNQKGFGWARFYAPCGTADAPAARFEIMYVSSVLRDNDNPRFEINIADISDDDYITGTPKTNGFES
jgi:hypothetical protein